MSLIEYIEELECKLAERDVEIAQYRDAPVVARKRSLKIGDALYTLPPTAEQIEQETAETIAKHFEQSGIGGEYLSEAIRSGKWKEYK